METDSTVDVTTTEGTDSLAPTESEGESFNQAWAPLLDALPEQLRTMESVTNPLKEWDKNYQKLQEEFKPFKELPEQYRNPEYINQAGAIFERLQADPNGFLKLLAENLGVSLAEAKEIVKEEVKPEPVVPLEFGEDDDPRLPAMAKQIKEQQDRFDKYFQQQTEIEQKKINDAAAAEQGKLIDAQVTKLISDKVIPNDPEVLKDLMMRATIAMQQGSRDPITDAVKSQQAFTQQLQGRINPQPAKQPLLFMPTTGAAPANGPTQPDLNTANGRIEMARQIAQLSQSS